MMRVCRVCGTANAICGDDHMGLAPISSHTIKGDAMTTPNESTSPDAPVELKEYEYYVGHMPIRAQLTAEQAEKLGAKAPGEAEAPQVGQVPNTEAERAASQQKEPDTAGATNAGEDPEALNKARDTRNRRAR